MLDPIAHFTANKCKGSKSKITEKKGQRVEEQVATTPMGEMLRPLPSVRPDHQLSLPSASDYRVDQRAVGGEVTNVGVPGEL